MTFILSMHHIVFVLYFFFVLTCSLPLVFVFLFALCLGPYPSTMLGRLELIGFPLLHLYLPLGVSFLGTTVVKRPLRN